MFQYSCIFHYGDKNVGSSGLVYFQTQEEFEGWFKNSLQIRWAILVRSDSGEVIATLSRPAPKFGQ